MQIQLKGTNYQVNSDIQRIVERKITGLEKYIGRVGDEPRAYVDLGKETEAHNNGNIWYADCSITAEGKRYYAKASAETLRSAFDKMTKELARELRHDRKRKHSLIKRSGARVKDLLRFS